MSLLGVDNSSYISNERMHSRVYFKNWTYRTVFRHDDIISLVIFYQILICRDNESVAFSIAWKVGINPTEFFLNLDIGLEFFMCAIKRPISSHNKEQMSKIPGEVFLYNLLGKLMVKIRPDCDIDVFRFFSEKIVEEFFPSFSVTDFVVVVEDRVVKGNWFGGGGSE